jgi:hypothetical protein
VAEICKDIHLYSPVKLVTVDGSRYTFVQEEWSLVKLRMCSIRWWVDSDEGTGKNADRSHLGLAWNTIPACIRMDWNRQRKPAAWAISVHSLNYNWTFHQYKSNLSHTQFSATLSSNFCKWYLQSVHGKEPVLKLKYYIFRWGLVLMWTQSKIDI